MHKCTINILRDYYAFKLLYWLPKFVVHESKLWRRQVFRETDGKALVWGKKPKVIVAKYKTASGDEASLPLLASGAVVMPCTVHFLLEPEESIRDGLPEP